MCHATCRTHQLWGCLVTAVSTSVRVTLSLSAVPVCIHHGADVSVCSALDPPSIHPHPTHTGGAKAKLCPPSRPTLGHFYCLRARPQA
eukprot:1827954-Rhodomonas_salina.1